VVGRRKRLAQDDVVGDPEARHRSGQLIDYGSRNLH
jgi:hypothetical protein